MDSLDIKDPANAGIIKSWGKSNYRKVLKLSEDKKNLKGKLKEANEKIEDLEGEIKVYKSSTSKSYTGTTTPSTPSAVDPGSVLPFLPADSDSESAGETEAEAKDDVKNSTSKIRTAQNE